MKVRDEIIEVNGHNCKAMSLEQLMQLKSLLQYVGAKKSEGILDYIYIYIHTLLYTLDAMSRFNY